MGRLLTHFGVDKSLPEDGRKLLLPDDEVAVGDRVAQLVLCQQGVLAHVVLAGIPEQAQQRFSTKSGWQSIEREMARRSGRKKVKETLEVLRVGRGSKR